MTPEAKAILKRLDFDSLTKEALFMLELEPLANGYEPTSFVEYWTMRRRQWMITQLDSVMALGKKKQRGEGDLFEGF